MFYAEEKAPLTFEKYLENKEKVLNMDSIVSGFTRRA